MNCNPKTMMRSTVVGIYGISGSGKSHILSQLREKHPEWRCLEGADVIEQALEAKGQSFETFRTLDQDGKANIRNAAIHLIQAFRGVALVTGHCSFPAHSVDDVESKISFEDVFTVGDGETYDFIYYLDTTADVVFQQRNADSSTAKRARPALSVGAIEQWIEHEKATLKRECDSHGIQFETIQDLNELSVRLDERVIQPLVKAAKKVSELALQCAVESIPASAVYLLIDGDRTLCAEDTGKLFFDDLNGSDSVDPQKQIFKRFTAYTFQAFLEVAMLYERVLPDPDYQKLSKGIGRRVNLYPKWILLLLL